jgi:hypothetical protein
MCMLSWICGYTRDRIRNDDTKTSRDTSVTIVIRREKEMTEITMGRS